jgi:hypothetical protein
MTDSMGSCEGRCRECEGEQDEAFVDRRHGDINECINEMKECKAFE